MAVGMVLLRSGHALCRSPVSVVCPRLVWLIVHAAQASAATAWTVRCSRDPQCKDAGLACSNSCAGEQKQTLACNDVDCLKSERPNACPRGVIPQPCAWSDWSQWEQLPHPASGDCSGLCERSRSVLIVNRCGGAPCSGVSAETRHCPCSDGGDALVAEEADEDSGCGASSWGEWTVCGADNPGQRTRLRTAVSLAESGDCAHIVSNETEACDWAARHIKNCELGPWMEWTLCTAKCNGGQRSRMRHITQKAANGGRNCEAPLQEVVACGTQRCVFANARDCQTGVWSDWSECEDPHYDQALFSSDHAWPADHDTYATQRVRHRSIAQSATRGGQVCNQEMSETTKCRDNEKSHANDCAFSPWSEWSLCSKECDGGQSFRSRTITSLAREGGGRCHDATQETKSCQTIPCSLLGKPCVASDWGEWSMCSRTCAAGANRGERLRSRDVLHQAAGGEGCELALRESVACQNLPVCDIAQCRWGDWSFWSDCSATCDGGFKVRHRNFEEPAMGGRACAQDKNAEEVTACGQLPCKVPEPCRNGTWSAWGDWGACSKSCRGGWKARTRSPAPANSCGVPALGNASEVAPCGIDVECERDEDCVLGPWQPWSLCNDPCGGVSERTRKVVFNQTGRGMCSGSLAQTVSCGSATAQKGCPAWDQTDCKFSDWSDWGFCDTPCDGGRAGRRTRNRKVIQAAKGLGSPCGGSLLETSPCDMAHCPVPLSCVWGAWSAWSDCTHCGGQMFRHRAVERLPAAGGKECIADALKETDKCDRVCAKSEFLCVWKDWSPFTLCTVTCGNGTRSRTRSQGFVPRVERPADPSLIASVASDETDCAGMLSEVHSCDGMHPCILCVPEDCEFSAWSDWSSPACEGLCRRTRTVLRRHSCGGSPCAGALAENKQCEPVCDDRDCKMTAWNDWSGCSATSNQRYQSRSIEVWPQYAGEPCFGALNSTASCALPAAGAVDCILSQWSLWSACTATCGSGQQNRVRNVTVPASGNGRVCESPLSVTRPCGANVCIITGHDDDCILSAWDTWETCSGWSNMQVSRIRHVKQEARYSGKRCAGNLRETGACSVTELTPHDCQWAAWSMWSSCSKSCDGGSMRRTRSWERTAEVNRGRPCGGSMLETKSCATQQCESHVDADCMLSVWSIWSPCSKTCGGGFQHRWRQVDRNPIGRGRACGVSADGGELVQSRFCANNTCNTPADCLLGPWSHWGDCEQAAGECGIGYRKRSRPIEKFPTGTGKCPPKPREEAQPFPHCHGQSPCCVDGEWAEWGPWSGCSRACGNGTQTRHRHMAPEPNYCGIAPAGSATDLRQCNAIACVAKDCRLSGWQRDGGCSALCHGTSVWTRKVADEAAGGGKPCSGVLRKVEPCNPASGEDPPSVCQELYKGTVSCQLSKWSDWSDCTSTCSNATRARRRSLSSPPDGSAISCPSASLEEITVCNAGVSCVHKVLDCVWTDWGEWGMCDADLHQRLRHRAVIVATATTSLSTVSAGSRGKECEGPDRESQGCGMDCLVEELQCAYSEWTTWSDCENCGGAATRSRIRTLEINHELLQMDFDLPDSSHLRNSMTRQGISRIRRSSGIGAYAARWTAVSAAFGLGALGLGCLVILARASAHAVRCRQSASPLGAYEPVAQS